MGKADVSSKHILAGEPVEWVRWLLQDATAEVEECLSGEFQFIQRYSDEIFRVRGQTGPFLLAVEVQLRVDPRMPRRMRAYAALAEEKYDLPIYPVVFYLLPPGAGVTLPVSYHSEFMGLTAHQDFRVVPVWEMKARRVLEEGVVALVPFTPLMQGGADEGTLRAGVRLLREREVGEEAEVALALFAGFVMKPERIQQIVRWDMVVLRESPWYKQLMEEEVLQEVEQRRHEWLEQGLQQGVERARRQDIVHLLWVRLDPTSPHLTAIAEQLAAIEDAEQLQDLLVEAARAPSLEAFLEHLDGKGKT